MERTIQLQEHYGAVVWTHIEMDTARKTECLCRLCDRRAQSFLLSVTGGDHPVSFRPRRFANLSDHRGRLPNPDGFRGTAR